MVDSENSCAINGRQDCQGILVHQLVSHKNRLMKYLVYTASLMLGLIITTQQKHVSS